MKLGIISDTHGYIDQRIEEHLSSCDAIWHAGDIGTLHVMERLEQVVKCSAVYGNIDGTAIRSRYPEYVAETVEGVRLLMIHIAGPFGKYHPEVKALIRDHRPNVLICGHSHILKVAFDKRFDLLYLNPGAAGRHGFHKVRTLVRLDVAEGKVTNCEVVELGPRSTKSVD